jgi:hypothetical protein
VDTHANFNIPGSTPESFYRQLERNRDRVRIRRVEVRSKHEIRNSKQIQMTQKTNDQNKKRAFGGRISWGVG